jgi:hypothetical protein
MDSIQNKDKPEEEEEEEEDTCYQYLVGRTSL